MARYAIIFSFIIAGILGLGCVVRWRCPIWLAYFGGINLVTLILFGVDKVAALRKAGRISEAMLLLLSAAGGSPAAWLGQRLWRHKIAKEPFQGRFRWVVTIQIVLMCGWVGLLLYWA